MFLTSVEDDWMQALACFLHLWKLIGCSSYIFLTSDEKNQVAKDAVVPVPGIWFDLLPFILCGSVPFEARAVTGALCRRNVPAPLVLSAKPMTGRMLPAGSAGFGHNLSV